MNNYLETNNNYIFNSKTDWSSLDLCFEDEKIKKLFFNFLNKKSNTDDFFEIEKALKKLVDDGKAICFKVPYAGSFYTVWRKI